MTRTAIRPDRGILTIGFDGEGTILNEAATSESACLVVLVTTIIFGRIPRANIECNADWRKCTLLLMATIVATLALILRSRAHG